MPSVTAADFKKLSAANKRQQLNGADIWPVETVARGKDKEILMSAVHKPSGETVISVPVEEKQLHSAAVWWFYFTSEGTNVQRTYLLEKYPDTMVWSVFALMADLSRQLEDVSTIDEAGNWQASVISQVDDMDLQSSLSNLTLEDFVGTLDGSVIKLSPTVDVIHLWYAASCKLAADNKTRMLVKLHSDTSGDKGMGKVLRPSPLSQNDMLSYLRTIRKKTWRQLQLPDTVVTSAQPVVSWKSLMKESKVAGQDSDKPMTEKLQILLAIPHRAAVQRAVASLQVLMGKRLDRQLDALLAKSKDAEGLLSIMTKFWSKKTPLEQGEIEEDLGQWIAAVRDLWGDTGAVKSRRETLERIEKAMQKFVEMQQAAGKDLNWSDFAQEGAMELTNHEDDEFGHLMDLLLDFREEKSAPGSEAQERALRTMLVKAVGKCTLGERRKELADAFDQVVGNAADTKKAAESFLSNRVGAPVGSVELPDGCVRVATQDVRRVVKLTWSTTEDATRQDIEGLASKLLGLPVVLSDKLQRVAWGLARIPQAQLDMLLGTSDARAFLTDNKKVEIEVRVRTEGAKEPYFLEVGHWTNLAAGDTDVVRKRPLAEVPVGVEAQRTKVARQGKGGNPRSDRPSTGFSARYDRWDRPKDHSFVRMDGRYGGKGVGAQGRF